MSNCECSKPVIKVPVRGLELSLDTESLEGLGGTGEVGISYSLEEQWTGKYWIDGKKVYQKSINFGALPGNEEKTVPHGIANMMALASLDGNAWNNTAFKPIPFSSAGTYPVAVQINKTHILVRSHVAGNTAYTNCVFTLKYTCTDR